MGRRMNLVEKTESIGTVTAAINSAALDASGGESLSAQVVVTGSSSPTGASVKLQHSNDGSNWSDVAAATNITADGNICIAKIDPEYRHYRAAFAISTGSFVASIKWLVKGNG